ncbi:MAG: hypothetical protein ACT4P7_17895 [Gemmatimonadaceae bacterium]
MSAVPQPASATERHLRLVEAEGRAGTPSWRFVLRGALTWLVLGAVSILALVLSA